MLRRLPQHSVAILWVLLCTSPAWAVTPMAVATFNCEWLIRNQVHRKYDTSSFTPAERDQRLNEAVEAVARAIVSINVDVIALTEIGPEADVEDLRIAVKYLGLDYPYKAVCVSGDTATTACYRAVALPICLDRYIVGRTSVLRCRVG